MNIVSEASYAKPVEQSNHISCDCIDSVSFAGDALGSQLSIYVGSIHARGIISRVRVPLSLRNVLP